jgi:hypothetical protein
MTGQPPQRDERTLAVENAGYRWSYHGLSFGILAIVAYRAFAGGEASWDLMALVVLGGVVNATYQGLQRVLYRRWVVMSVVTFAIALALSAGLVILEKR